MALGNYGITRPADFEPSDCEVFYTYSARRTAKANQNIVHLDPSSVLEAMTVTDGNIEQKIGGIYNLRLPSESFSTNGIYDIVIRPKQIKTKILDCGTLSGLPNIKGVVLDLNDQILSDRTNLDGYRIQYIDNGIVRDNFFRIVTSSNRVEPISENITSSSSQKTIRYRLNESGSLLFLTLTPSSNNIEDVSLTTPFIGYPNQNIILSNTFFDPLMVEVEIVEDTIETLANALYGNQIKEIATGKYGMYDKDGNLFKAFNLFEVLNEFGEKQYEIKQLDNTITQEDLDFNKIIDKIKTGR